MHKLAVFIEFGLEKQPDNVVLIIPESLSLSRAFKERGKSNIFGTGETTRVGTFWPIGPSRTKR